MFSFAASSINCQSLNYQLKNKEAGALATFEGWVRNHNEGKTVLSLEYEAFTDLANKEGNEILQETLKKYKVLQASCVHRIGTLEPGDLAVWVGVTAHHRLDAIQACQYIIDEVKHRLPIWKKEHYVNGDSQWVNCQVHEHQHVESTPASSTQKSITKEEFYSRQVILPEIGQVGQDKLSKAKVLVVGAGGLGAPALTYLAAAGVGTIGIVEFDHLETSNLHRQVLYSHQDIGKDKANLAAQKLKQINPFSHISIHNERLEPKNVRQLFSGYDLVLDCTDNFESKFLLNDAAIILEKPLILASIYQYEGQIQLVYRVKSLPCLRCLWKEIPERQCVGSCAEVGVLGAVPGIFGTMQALEAIKIILGMKTPLTEGVLLFDLLSYETSTIKGQRDATCPVCSIKQESDTLASLYPPVKDPDIEIDVTKLSDELLKGFELIDIREPEETANQPFENVRQIPFSTWDKGDPPIKANKRCLLFCQQGIRSRRLALKLRQLGFSHIYSVNGGIASLTRRLNEAGSA